MRPRVNRLLDASASTCVTLVSAPPGYGKSVAVASWLATQPAAAAWVTADTHDNDPLRLWTYIVAGIQQALSGVGARARERLRAGDPTADPAIEVLAAELERDGRELVIVIDDLDRVVNARRLATITHAARALPANARLLLIARSDPALPLPRWRANGELTEIRASDLAFTRSEAAQLLTRAEGLTLSEPAIGALVERTEGWPAALHLATLRMRSSGTTLEGFNGRQRTVARYLATEVLAELDDDLRSFLVATSVLPRLSADLCDAVLERDDAADMLERAGHANLFLVALDEEGVWFRYQALFAEYLQAELDEERAVRLHRRASRWFRDHGEIEDAVEHAASGGDLETVAALLEEHHLELARGGRADTIDRWVAALPQDLLTARPGVLTAGVLAAGGSAQPRDDARRLLALAARARDADPDRWTLYHEGACLLLRALYEDDDVARATESARAAVAVAQADVPQLEVVATALLAHLRLLAGATEEADALARAAIEHPRAPVSPYGLVGALATRALVAVGAGRPQVATALADRALEEIDRAGIADGLPAAFVHFALARIALAEGRPADAERSLRKALRVRDAIEGGALHAWMTATLAEALALRGRIAVADGELSFAREIVAGCADPGVAPAAVEAGAHRIEDLRAGAAAPVEPLSKAELAVLRLFGEDRSARAIGGELYLSLNTVKTHIRAIYRKLGVASRQDALARAEELGLL